MRDSASGVWINASVKNFRRAELISENLKTPKGSQNLQFLDARAQKPVHGFYLISESEMLIAHNIKPPFIKGEMQFIDDKRAPSRAYLKLWELFTVYNLRPTKKDICLDLGSCPGGWTWVLAQLGCQVLSVDKAKIESSLIQHPRVTYIQKDAFTLRAKDLFEQKPCWLFSDIICEPRRLLELIQTWESEKNIRHFVCTVKFKGDTDHDSLESLLKYPASWAQHLHHNKHEVTWVWSRD